MPPTTQRSPNPGPATLPGALSLLSLLYLAGCGGGDDGPAIQARPQSITFGTTPTLSMEGTATVSATTSSGLPVRYVAQTSSICSVDKDTGLVTSFRTGECMITAVQDGDATYAPARASQTIPIFVDPVQTVSFAPAPTLAKQDIGTVSATASSGLPVTYSSLTPTVCTVEPDSGQVTAVAVGNCSIAADQAGTTTYPVYYAAQAILTFAIAPPPGTTLPGRPNWVSASLGSTVRQVIVRVGGVNAGDRPITGYTVTSSPPGITGTGTRSPITVSCPMTCVGYAFAVHATTEVGDGPDSDPVDVITTYEVEQTFHEPATQPNDTIFTGTFVFDSTNRVVSNLRGDLTQSMTTDGSDPDCVTIAGCPGGYGKVPMTTVYARHQLITDPVTLDGAEGVLVATFVRDTTNTFFDGFGGDGWSPGHGVAVGGIYYGWPTELNPFNGGVGNSYAMIFVNTNDPTKSLTQAQINMLAYADCSPGGMMGAVCMTGTSIEGYGAVGTMGGYPHRQVIRPR